MTEITLESISPIAFDMCKVGDIVIIRLKNPKFNEFRSKIGPATVSFLVFKNQTKIGMIPTNIIRATSEIIFKNKKARLIAMNQKDNIIKIKLLESANINV